MDSFNIASFQFRKETEMEARRDGSFQFISVKIIFGIQA